MAISSKHWLSRGWWVWWPYGYLLCMQISCEYVCLDVCVCVASTAAIAVERWQKAKWLRGCSARSNRSCYLYVCVCGLCALCASLSSPVSSHLSACKNTVMSIDCKNPPPPLMKVELHRNRGVFVTAQTLLPGDRGVRFYLPLRQFFGDVESNRCDCRCIYADPSALVPEALSPSHMTPQWPAGLWMQRQLKGVCVSDCVCWTGWSVGRTPAALGGRRSHV